MCLPDDWGQGYRNVWLGVSAELQYLADRRMDTLRNIPAKLRWVSCEPLLRPLKLNLQGFSWVVCRWGCRKLDGKMHQEFPVPTLTCTGTGAAKQKEHILRTLDESQINRFGDATENLIQPEYYNNQETVSILLTTPASNAQLSALQAKFPGFTITQKP